MSLCLLVHLLLHGRGGLSLDSNPVCLRVNATSLDQDLDKDARVNGAIDNTVVDLTQSGYPSLVPRPSSTWPGGEAKDILLQGKSIIATLARASIQT